MDFTHKFRAGTDKIRSIRLDMLERAEVFYYFQRGEFRDAAAFLEALLTIADHLADFATLAAVGQQILGGLRSEQDGSDQRHDASKLSTKDQGLVVAGLVHDLGARQDVLEEMASEGVLLKKLPVPGDRDLSILGPPISGKNLPRYVVTEKEWMAFTHVSDDGTNRRHVVGQIGGFCGPDNVMIRLLRDYFGRTWRNSDGPYIDPRNPDVGQG